MKENPVNDALDLLREITKSLREIGQWVRLIGYPAAKATMIATLDTEEKRIVYHLSNGRRRTKEIATLSGVNVRYVSEWGQSWEAIGILTQSRVSSVRGRRQKMFKLSDFGLSVPDKYAKFEEQDIDGTAA